jgi:hypothetical protein
MLPIRDGGVRATASARMAGRAATVGLIRGVTVGLMVGTREPTFRLGVRMMLCACTAEGPKAISGNSAAENAHAARWILARQLTPS